MAKKKLSKLSTSDEAALSKLSRKERVNAVYGKPDQSDIDNINELLRLYERSQPGAIKKMKADYDMQTITKEWVPKPRGITSNDLRFAFWLPRDLQEFMEIYYPSIWTNKEHADWFIKHYPIFKA